ncbi:MAG: hypothetical protein WC842_03700 [Candidatus Paceibacterota bacterium]
MKKSEFFGIIVSAILVIILYLNIGNYYVEVINNVVNNGAYLGNEVDEILIVGKDYSLAPSSIDFVGKALTIGFWPLFLICSLITWILWIIFGGGLTVFIGIELVCFFFVILLGILIYLIFRKRKK